MAPRTYTEGRLLASLLGVTACLAVIAQPAFADKSPPVSAGQTQAGAEQGIAAAAKAAPQGASGMTIYIDPQTGAILNEPAPGTVPLQWTPALQNALSTSQQGLVETPAAGGGVKVDLQGRFQSPLTATIDANGDLRMQHLHERPASGHTQ